MKQKVYITVWLFCACLLINAQEIIAPSVKTSTTFAIVVDSISYEKAREELMTYKESVEQDGLGTYLLVDNWKSPEYIRTLLMELHASDTPLEGCVFVGDIPIPMLRDAQHLTSAFKMDQRRDWKKSSVPSDRYYDDFGLKFDFIRQDEDTPLYYYYSLRADSKQYLSPDIYSGRIKPLELEGVDKYELLREYLQRVVEEKQTNASNVVDYLSMGRGHGYNSEDPLVWSNEQLALREQMPTLFRPNARVKFFEFDAKFPIKNTYLNEIQSEGLDIMLFHHHGASDTQYLNGYENVSTPAPSIENVKRFLRSKISAMTQKQGREEAIAYYMNQYGVPREWCEEAFDSAKLEADSLFNLTLDIHTTDIHPLKPQARFIMLDACFNGSFYEKDYIAGAYLFANGKTMAVQGSTVNTIQDKWPDEFLGLLAAGMRIGQFNRLTCFLENHILGDPTFHFANNLLPDLDINQALVLHEGDTAFWRVQLSSGTLPDVCALALRELAKTNAADVPALLEDTYFNSDYFVVRLEALRLLALNYPEASIRTLQAAIDDSYELIRRFAAEYIEKNASPELIPAFVNAYLERSHEARLIFKLQSGLSAFDPQALLQEIKRQVEKKTFYDTTYVETLKKNIVRREKSTQADLTELADTTAKASRVHLDIVAYRNHPATVAIKPLLAFIADESRDQTLRLNAIETLGWFNEHYHRHEIIQSLRSIQTNDSTLDNEIDKTIRRLTTDGLRYK